MQIYVQAEHAKARANQICEYMCELNIEINLSAELVKHVRVKFKYSVSRT